MLLLEKTVSYLEIHNYIYIILWMTLGATSFKAKYEKSILYHQYLSTCSV